MGPPLLLLSGLAAALGGPALVSMIQTQEPASERTSTHSSDPGDKAAAVDDAAAWRVRERALLRRIDELEVALRDEQVRSLTRQQQWIEFARVLNSFELPALPPPPAFIEEALLEPPDPLAVAAAREQAGLRVRAREIERALTSLFRVEGIHQIGLLEIGLLHEHAGRTWTGPVIARLLDDHGRMVGMLKASRMRLETSRAARIVTLVLEDGYESRGGVRRPFDGGTLVPSPERDGKLVASGGVRRIFLGAVDPGPWIDAVPELIDSETLDVVVDDGLWNLTRVRLDIVRLLKAAAGQGDPSWRLAAIGGVRGADLRDVRFAETDILSGRTKRLVFADSARIVARQGGGIELRLEGGSVRRGDRVAPFLAGRYRIVLPRADASAWKNARLPGLSSPLLKPAVVPDSAPKQDGSEDEKGDPPLR